MNPKKSGKNSFANLVAVNNTKTNKNNNNLQPILKEVGKLAAGIASVNTISSGSATGNPRNKCALQPGHSLMDWIRLGASGKDLTGVGSQAGSLSITPGELSKHNKETDAWLAIRGRVFNVTSYIPFHPGGINELMRGIGSDATNLFEQTHPWVNYEQLLQKCFIGKLVIIDPDINTDNLFINEGKTTTTTTKIKTKSKTKIIVNNSDRQQLQVSTNTPRFDWIQKLDYITVFFYTRPYSNPLIEIKILTQKLIEILIIYDNYLFINELNFLNDIVWPCNTKITYEIGKIEIIFRKYNDTVIWDNYGGLKQSIKLLNKSDNNNYQIDLDLLQCEMSKRFQINHDSYLIQLNLINRKIITPIGYHINIYFNNDINYYKNYTPIPSNVFNKSESQLYSTDEINLLIKSYPNGKLSQYLTETIKFGDQIQISKPYGNFNLNNLEKRDIFMLLAAGTGITPMLSLILFLLERRIRKCRSIYLLYFNKTTKDILLNDYLDDLMKKSNNRFHIKHILSQADDSWNGLKGHITKSLLETILTKQIKTNLFNKSDIYIAICGPPIFSQLALKFLNELSIIEEQIHVFHG